MNRHSFILLAAALSALAVQHIYAQEMSARPDSGFHHHHAPREIQPLLNPDSTDIYRISDDTVYVNSVRLGRDIKGYRDVTPVEIAIVDDKVVSVSLLNNHESRGYIRKITSAGFFDAWNGLSVAEAQKRQVDIISGATYSSDAIRQNVSLALNYYQQQNLGRLVAGNSMQVFPWWYYPLGGAIGGILLILIVRAIRRKKSGI